MTPQKRQRLMFAVLIASVLFGLYMKPWERRGTEAPEVAREALEATVVPENPKPISQSIEYAVEWPSQDPFTRHDARVVVTQSVATEPESYGEPSFALQGIMTMNGQVACVIDGKTYAVGSQVAGWKLEKVDAEGVWVSQGGERHFVRLP